MDENTQAVEPARLLALIDEMTHELHPAAPRQQAGLDSSLERDLGFDSLARMELLNRIETAFGAGIPERVVAEAETPRDLLRGITASPSASGRPAARAPARTRGPQDEREARTTPAASASEREAQKEPARREIIPASVATLTDALAWQAENHPHQPHIHLYGDDPEQADAITFAELAQDAGHVASGLAAAGLEPGESVLIMLPTGRGYFASFMGVLMAGGVPVPVYPPGRPAQIEDHLRRHAKIAGNCRAAVMITDPAALKFSHLMSSLAPTLRHVATPEDLASAAALTATVSAAGSDTAFIQYTSGSTGDPKGVVLSHANLLANIRAMGQALEAGPEDVFVSWLPLYHDMGLIGAWLGSLVHGMELAIMPPLAFLARPERWLRAIHNHRGTISGAPNFAYEACVRRIGDAQLADLDLSSWRVAFDGAEPVSTRTLEAFAERFAPCGFRREALMPVYGLAENSVGLAFPPLGRGPRLEAVDRDQLMKAGVAAPADGDGENALVLPACGYPLPGHQIRIVDANGREVPERHEGRIQFTGPSATAGYLHNPEANTAMFQGEWLDSGDLGFIAEGELFVTGRSKDMIIRAGRNIFPAELEAAIGGLDGIQAGNVAVFASGDAQAEAEKLVVMAETRHRDAARRDALVQAIGGLSSDLVGVPPDDVVLVPPRSVPKTSSGKIRRQAARALYESGKAGAPGAGVRLQLLRLAVAAAPGVLRRTIRRLTASLFAAWAWLLVIVVSVPAWLLVAMTPSERVARAIARAALAVLRTGTGLPLRVEGVENLPADGNYVIAANHSSYLDGAVLTAALPAALSFVAKGELAGQRVAGIFLRRLGTEFVERFDTARASEDAGRLTERVRRGQPLAYFPEGTLSRMPGLLAFHLGAFAAAVDADVPVVPVVIRGTRAVLRDTSWFPRRGTIRVRVLPPMRAEAEGTNWARALELRDRVRAEILRHAGEPDLAHERIIPEAPAD